MSVGAIYIARIDLYKIERISVNSLRWLQYENYQRRSGAVRHGAEHINVRRHLAPIH
jgi:hypothetical protein